MTATWRDLAPCAPLPVATFFPTCGGGAGAYAEAFEVCRRCPVRVECLEAFYAQPDPVGVGVGAWGGTTPGERQNPGEARRTAREGRPEWRDDVDVGARRDVGRATHGSEWAYRRGCRCTRCVTEQRARFRQQNRARARRAQERSV